MTGWLLPPSVSRPPSSSPYSHTENKVSSHFDPVTSLSSSSSWFFLILHSLWKQKRFPSIHISPTHQYPAQQRHKNLFFVGIFMIISNFPENHVDDSSCTRGVQINNSSDKRFLYFMTLPWMYKMKKVAWGESCSELDLSDVCKNTTSFCDLGETGSCFVVFTLLPSGRSALRNSGQMQSFTSC